MTPLISRDPLFTQVFIVSLVSTEKYCQFRDVLNVYIDEDFCSTLAYKFTPHPNPYLPPPPPPPYHRYGALYKYTMVCQQYKYHKYTIVQLRTLYQGTIANMLL